LTHLHGRTELTFLGTHGAFWAGQGGFLHASIIVMVGAGSEYWEDSRFIHEKYGGKVKVVTMGGDMNKDGKLVGLYDRESDLNFSIKREMQLLNVSSGQIGELFAATNSFQENANINYWAFGPGVKNSNSFARGLLDAVGISYNKPKWSLPGWGYRIPKSIYGR